MLEGLSFQKYLQTPLNDNLMLNLRKEYFYEYDKFDNNIDKCDFTEGIDDSLEKI